MRSETRNLFIIHASRDEDVFQEFKAFFREKGYESVDDSLPGVGPGDAANEDFIQDELLAPRIAQADTVVVVISPATQTGVSVDWEIESAQKMGKRIVGVYVHGGTKSDLPKSFEKYGDALVAWRTERVLKAIAGQINDWVEPDGVTPFPEREIDHFSCGGEEDAA